jgi:TolA-binding protein
MARMIKTRGLRRMGVALLALIFAGQSVGVRAQGGTPSIAPLPDAPTVAAPALGTTNQELLERLLKMEDRHDQVTKQMADRLEQLTKQIEQLSREVRELRSANRDRNAEVDAAVDAMQPTTNEGGSANSGGPSGMPPATSGGGSASGGGDPTKSGSAQLVGNRHLGQSALLGGSYDFENDGFR